MLICACTVVLAFAVHGMPPYQWLGVQHTWFVRPHGWRPTLIEVKCVGDTVVLSCSTRHVCKVGRFLVFASFLRHCMCPVQAACVKRVSRCYCCMHAAGVSLLACSQHCSTFLLGSICSTVTIVKGIIRHRVAVFVRVCGLTLAVEAAAAVLHCQLPCS